MIVVDTSALAAIMFREPEALSCERAIFEADQVAIGAPTLFEFLMVAAGRRRGVGEQPEVMRARFQLQVVPWSEEHAELAQEAFLRFGKGTRHPAQLNFGDCMSYAVAKALDAPLLYKGDDFVHTDIRGAL